MTWQLAVPTTPELPLPILDLVSPWASAVAAESSARARAEFRTRWATVLEAVRRQRSPLASQLAMPLDVNHLVERARDPALAARLQELLGTLRDLGIDPPPHQPVLIAIEAPGDGWEAIPDPANAMIFLCLDRLGDDLAISAAATRALTSLVRWSNYLGSSMPCPLLEGGWDRWRIAREVPLAEWIYGAGLAEHAVRATCPGITGPVQFGMSQAAFQRLREQERSLRERLAADLPLTGLGSWLRWMGDGSPPSIRSDGGLPIPEGTGRYLAWRLTESRVERVGLGAALRLTA